MQEQSLPFFFFPQPCSHTPGASLGNPGPGDSRLRGSGEAGGVQEGVLEEEMSRGNGMQTELLSAPMSSARRLSLCWSDAIGARINN